MAKEASVNLSKKIFNPVYLPVYHKTTSYTLPRYLVLFGGAGSGKSYFIAQQQIIKIMAHKGRNLLVLRQVADTNRDSTFALFKQVISRWEGIHKFFNVHESDMRIRCKNGNDIIFKGLDDPEKLKSITFSRGELTDVWIEEASEVTQEDFTLIDLRLRGGELDKNITLSFNPVNVNHWLKGFTDARGPDKLILKTTYKDNLFIDAAYAALLEGYKDKDEYFYSVYCLGEWGVYGKTVFPAGIVSERIAALRKLQPLKVGYFTCDRKPDGKPDDKTIIWQDAPDGWIRVYEQPERYTPYVVGGDTAGDGSDRFTGHVLNNLTGNQAAVLLRQNMDEDLYAEQLYCLSKHYNKALIGVEVNFSTYPVKVLTNWGAKQFVRMAEDTYTGRHQKAYGVLTGKNNRNPMIAELIKQVRDNVSKVNDMDTLDEMLTFVRSEKGRPEAQQGAHDDLIMGLAIAHYIRPQGGHELAGADRKYVYNFEHEKPKADEMTGGALDDSYINYGMGA